MTIPTRIRMALADYVASDHAVEGEVIKPGDIRLVRDLMADQELHVLVVKVSSSPSFCEVLLLHPYREMMTNADVLLDAEQSSASYPLIAQTDIRGVLWTVDVGRAIGKVDVSEGVFDVGSNTYLESALTRGTRLAGPSDSRWAFKLEQGRLMASISASCIAGLLEDSGVFTFDLSSDIDWIRSLDRRSRLIASTRISDLRWTGKLLIEERRATVGSVRIPTTSDWIDADRDFPMDLLLKTLFSDLEDALLYEDQKVNLDSNLLTRDQLLEHT